MDKTDKYIACERKIEPSDNLADRIIAAVETGGCRGRERTLLQGALYAFSVAAAVVAGLFLGSVEQEETYIVLNSTTVETLDVYSSYLD